MSSENEVVGCWLWNVPYLLSEDSSGIRRIYILPHKLFNEVSENSLYLNLIDTGSTEYSSRGTVPRASSNEFCKRFFWITSDLSDYPIRYDVYIQGYKVLPVESKVKMNEVYKITNVLYSSVTDIINKFFTDVHSTVDYEAILDPEEKRKYIFTVKENTLLSDLDTIHKVNTLISFYRLKENLLSMLSPKLMLYFNPKNVKISLFGNNFIRNGRHITHEVKSSPGINFTKYKTGRYLEPVIIHDLEADVTYTLLVLFEMKERSITLFDPRTIFGINDNITDWILNFYKNSKGKFNTFHTRVYGSELIKEYHVQDRPDPKLEYCYNPDGTLNEGKLSLFTNVYVYLLISELRSAGPKIPIYYIVDKIEYDAKYHTLHNISSILELIIEDLTDGSVLNTKTEKILELIYQYPVEQQTNDITRKARSRRQELFSYQNDVYV